MVTTVVSASIKCGSKNTRQRLNKIQVKENAEQIKPFAFRCRRCHQEWGYLDVSIDQDLDEVTCSNCYSSNVVIAKIQITWLEAKDFKP